MVEKELGLATANSMKSLLKGNNIIAVNGGTTMAAVAEMLTPNIVDGEWLFVPARGGIGEDVKNQANTICSMMADRTDSKHRVLYAPDEVSKEMYKSIVKDARINEVLQLIKSASLLIHGIGDAITMAERRSTSASDLEKSCRQMLSVKHLVITLMKTERLSIRFRRSALDLKIFLLFQM